MIKKILIPICGGIVGYVMWSIGYGVGTYQFWVITVLCGVIAALSASIAEERAFEFMKGRR